MVLDIVLYILVFGLIIAGLIGCFLPAIPGPPLSYIGYLLLLLTPSEGGVTWWTMIILAILTIITVVADFIIPTLGVKVFGGTKWGNWGCILGSVAGAVLSFCGMPLAIIIGPFLGAFFLEFAVCRDWKLSLRSGLGSFIGFVVGTGLKVVVVLVILFAAIVALFF